MQRCLYTCIYNNRKVIRVYKMILQQCFEFENVSVICPRSQIWDLAEIEHPGFLITVHLHHNFILWRKVDLLLSEIKGVLRARIWKKLYPI